MTAIAIDSQDSCQRSVLGRKTINAKRPMMMNTGTKKIEKGTKTTPNRR